MSISFDFSDKVALITGSSTGIGAATAIMFSKSGAQVVVTGRNAQNIQSVVKQCEDVSPKGHKPLAVIADITVEEDLKRLVRATIAAFGRLDILVNNAGIKYWTAITDPNYMERYHEMMASTLTSAIHLTHICVEHLAKTNGTVVNITTALAKQAVPSSSAYCMAKTALDTFTRCTAVELAHKHIRVNSINSGLIKTYGHYRESGPEMADMLYEKYANVCPVGRVGDPNDVAYGVLYLACGQSSSFITGTNMLIDGGHLAASVNMETLFKKQ